MDFLEKLKQDPNCLYIYNWGPYIYGLSIKPTQYLVITQNIPDRAIYVENGIAYVHYPINKWFQKVLNGDVDCWECACMNKKFIVKEHVKLMMSTNPLSLRKYVDKMFQYIPSLTSEDKLYYWEIIKACKFANQIIDNHKIVNFKEANKEHYLFEETSNPEELYDSLIVKPYEELKRKTDDILRRSKIEKILQKKKNE